MTTQTQGSNTLWPSTSSAHSVPNITDETWAMEKLRRAERIKYRRELFSQGEMEVDVRALADDPYAPTMVQITGEIKKSLKEQFNRS